MRIALRLLPAFALLVLSCSPSSGGPEVGGQTGDPGVADFESLDPGTDRQPGGMPGGGSCRGAIQVLAPRSYLPGAGYYQVAKLGETHAVLFDEARGLAIVDIAQAIPRLSARLFLPRSVGTLHVSGQYAFVSRRNVLEWAARFGNGYPQIGDEGELLAVDLSEPSAPRVVGRVALERAPRMSMLVASGGTTRLYVLTDGGAANGCASFDTEAQLTSYEWIDEQFVQRAVFALAGQPSGSSVQPLGDMLAMHSGGVSFISLAAPDGAMTQIAQVTSETVSALHVDQPGTLRLVSFDGRESHVDSYDVHDPLAPMRRRRCTVSGPLGGRTTFSPRHIFFASDTQNGMNTVTSVAMAESGTCEVRSFAGRRRSLTFSDVLGEGRVFDIDSNQSRDVTVRMLDDADLRLIGELTLPGIGDALSDPELGIQRGETRVLPGQEGALLSVALRNFDAALDAREGLQLFRFTRDSITAWGSVLPAAHVFELAAPAPIVWAKGTLAGLDLGDPDAPRLSESLDVLPSFSHVIAFDTHWARLRTAYESEYREELTSDELFASSAKGSLQLVPIDQDPDLARAEARVEANPYGRLIRVGSLLVSIARGYPPRASGPPKELGSVPTLFEVFDLSDPIHPKRTGELRIDALSVTDPCSQCTGSVLDTRDLVIQDALVLRTRTDSGELALRVLDLSDPANPSLSDPIARLEKEPILSAFTDGTSVYYTYRVRVADSSASVPRASFYFRRINFADPKAPRIAEPVSVPGQLVAIQDVTLYTRAFAQEGGTLGTNIHRLTLKDGKAELEATHAVGDRVALGIELSESGHVLVDLREPLQTFLYGSWTTITPTDLRVLDAQTLLPVGEAYIGPGASRLAVQGEHLLYSAAQGAVLMSLKDPTAPRAQAYIPIYGYGSGQGTLAGDSVILEDFGALKRFDLDFTNLP